MEGSNYLLWAESMKLFLCFQGVWQIVAGFQTQPIVPTSSTAAIIEEVQTKKDAWNNKDDSAFGYMMLRVFPSLHHLVLAKNYSSEIWTTLETTFGVQGPALIYVEFKSSLAIKNPAANPVLEINRMATVFRRLATEKIAILQVVQAMLLLAACLCEYDVVSSTLLQTYTNTNLMFDLMRNALVADVQCCASVSKPQQQSAVANKISTVKRKSPNPNCQPKQSHLQGESSSGNKDSNKGNSSHGKHAGKDKKKEKKKQQQQHGHLTSAMMHLSLP
jgi:hypothetical protein